MTTLNRQGDVKTKDVEELRRAKKADLVTLPKSVLGTNCFNCKWIKSKRDDIGYCSQPKVAQDVSKHQCCALWDNEGVMREFGKIDEKYA